MFYKKLPNPEKNVPLGVLTHVTWRLGPSHKINNLLCHECLARQQLSKMV